MRMGRRICLFAGLAALLLAFGFSSAWAQSSAAVDTHDQGSHQLAFSAWFGADAYDLDIDELDYSESGTLYSLAGQVTYAYFIRDTWAIGGALNFTRTWSDDEDSTGEYTDVLLLAQGKKYFLLSGGAIPYVGLQAGISSIQMDFGTESESSTGFAGGGMVGVEVMLSDRSSIFIEYNLLWTKHNFDVLGLDYSMSSWMHTVMAGLAVYF